MIFGPSWAARRDAFIPLLPRDGLVIDVGCGNGILLSHIPTRHGPTIGIDPSWKMVRRARASGCAVVQANAAHVPLANESTVAVVCTYPGSWILDADVWAELARIMIPGAPVNVLLGGTVTRGRFSGARIRLIGLIYGTGRSVSTIPDLALGHPLITGKLHLECDEWGEVTIWKGNREQR